MSFAPRTLAIAAALPGWMEALRHRAGPLLAAADDLQRWLGPDPFPEGRDGIRRLAELVDRVAFDQEFSDAEDARFVDGAGAMLGLLVIAHVGVGRHRERAGIHRVAVGELGFFDPFAAIDAALDAERPSAELSRRIADAESEAAGEGPISRVQVGIVAALRRAGTPRSVRDNFEWLAVLDDGTELDLSRFANLASDPASLDRGLDRLVAWLGRTETAPDSFDLEDARERLLPRLVARTFADELERTRGIEISFDPLVADIGIALVLGYEGRLRFLRKSEARAFAANGENASDIAMARLVASTDATRWRVDTLGGRQCAIGTRRDGLAATSILAPSVSAALAEKLGDPFIVALPHRDRLVATHDAGDLTALASFVSDEHRRAPHGIAGTLFRCREGRLEPIR